MKYDTAIYKGIFVAFNTLFDENDEINIEAMKLLANKYCELGVNGLYVCGSTGEGFLMSSEERIRTAKAVIEAVGGRIPVIVHIGSASTKEAIVLAKNAENDGATAISAVPSVYYRPGEKAIENHWNEIMNAVSLPFIIYNIPQLTGYDISFDLFKRMAEKEQVIGIKNTSESTCQTERFRKIAPKDFIIFNGPDEQLLAGRLMGANAGIGGTYGCMPELFLELERNIAAGNIDEAKQWQVKINDIIYKLLSFPSLYGATKAVMKNRFGIETGKPRLPFFPVDINNEEILKLCEEIEKSVKQISK